MGGLRIRAVKHKFEIADQWDELIVEESLHKRKDVRVAVGADGDGVMALIKEASRKRGIAYLPLPPYSDVLNMVECAVNYLKVGVASVLHATGMHHDRPAYRSRRQRGRRTLMLRARALRQGTCE